MCLGATYIQQVPWPDDERGTIEALDTWENF